MIVEMKGKQFGRLIVLGVAARESKAIAWEVKCVRLIMRDM